MGLCDVHGLNDVGSKRGEVGGSDKREGTLEDFRMVDRWDVVVVRETIRWNRYQRLCSCEMCCSCWVWAVVEGKVDSDTLYLAAHHVIKLERF